MYSSPSDCKVPAVYDPFEGFPLVQKKKKKKKKKKKQQNIRSQFVVGNFCNDGDHLNERVN